MTAPSGWSDQISAWMSLYGPAVKGFFLRRLRNQPAEADDLMQEVFLRLLKRRTDDVIDKPEQYIFQTAANVLRDYLRQGQVRRSSDHDPLADEIEDTGFTPERVLLGRDRLNRLLAALETLDERTRAVFVLHHFEAMKQTEVARHLGVSLSTVEKSLARANKVLIELKEKVGDS